MKSTHLDSSSRSLGNNAIGKTAGKNALKNAGSGKGAAVNKASSSRIFDNGWATLKSLQSRAIKVMWAKPKIVKWEVRHALKTVDKQLERFVQAKAMKMESVAEKASMKLLEALHQDRFSAELLAHVAKFSQPKLESLDTLLDLKTDAHSEHAIQLVKFSVKAELLDTKLNAMPGERKALGKADAISLDTMSAGDLHEIIDLRDIADQLLALVSLIRNPKHGGPLPRFTEEQLKNIVLYATKASKLHEDQRTKAADLLKKTQLKDLKSKSMEELKKLILAVEITKPAGSETHTQHAKLVNGVKAQIEQLERPIIESVIGKVNWVEASAEKKKGLACCHRLRPRTSHARNSLRCAQKSTSLPTRPWPCWRRPERSTTRWQSSRASASKRANPP